MAFTGSLDFSKPRTPRELDIVSGLDEFGPSDLELKDAQLGRNSLMALLSGGAYGYVPPREELRQDAMQRARRGLAYGNVAHQQKLQQELLPKQVEGQFDLAGKQLEGEYGVREAQTRGDSFSNVQRLKNEGQAAGLKELIGLLQGQRGAGGAGLNRSISVPGVGSIGAPPRVPPNRVTAGHMSALNRLRAAAEENPTDRPFPWIGTARPSQASRDYQLFRSFIEPMMPAEARLSQYDPQAIEEVQGLMAQFPGSSAEELTDIARQQLEGFDEADIPTLLELFEILGSN